MSAELRESKFVRRPSVASIISESIAWISFKFSLWPPLGHMPRRFFLIMKKKMIFFYEYFSFSLTYDPMVAKTSKRYPFLKSLLNLFNLFLNFLLSGPHKSTHFWNFEFSIFNEFLNFTIVPYGETKNLNYLQNKQPQSETELNLGLGVDIQCIQGTFDT